MEDGMGDLRRARVWGEHNTEIGVIYIIPSKPLPCQDYTNETHTYCIHRTQMPPYIQTHKHTHSQLFF